MSVAERMRDLVEADPVVVLEIAGAIANDGEGRWPAATVTDAAAAQAVRLASADKKRMRDAIEVMLMGRDVDAALEWLREAAVLPVLFPELAATVDLVQETGRQHKNVWDHTKQVVRQTVRRPLVRWAALLHDIGKVPTRTYTDQGVHFHGHAEVGARMFEAVTKRFDFARDERHTIRFLVRHHLRTNQYSEEWTDSAVRRFHREMAAYMTDLLDLSRADITSKRPGRRSQLLAQISALSDRVERLAEADAKLPPLPTGVGTAIMDAFEIAPSRLIGELMRTLEGAINTGEIEARREHPYYVAYLARKDLVPGASPEKKEAIIAAGGDLHGDPDDEIGPHKGVDPDDDSPGVLACGHDPENDPCVHRDADPEDVKPTRRKR